MSSLESWYGGGLSAGPGAFTVDEVFKEASKRFSSSFTNDPKKIATIASSTSIVELQEIVAERLTVYVDTHKFKTIRKWLLRFSEKLHHYGTILDVMAQHHPEYVALAWGAIKFLLVGFINHAVVLKVYVKALAEIGNELPRTEMLLTLFPIQHLKNAVIELVALVMKFLCQVQDWSKESKLMHTVHCVTRPPELRYQELLQKIAACSRNVMDWAMSCAHAEQRRMHQKLEEANDKVASIENVLIDMRDRLVTLQATTSSSFLDTNERLTDLQFCQILASIDTISLPDPLKTLQWCMAMRRDQMSTTDARNPQRFIPGLKSWLDTNQSSISFVRSAYNSKNDVFDLFTRHVKWMYLSSMPVVWVFPGRDRGKKLSTVDILKSLTKQILQLCTCNPTESGVSLTCAKVGRAVTESDWINILGSLLSSFRGNIHFVIDVDVQDSNVESFSPDFSWLSAFSQLFRELSSRGNASRIKVLLLSTALSSRPVHNRLDSRDYTLIHVRKPLFQTNNIMQRRKAGKCIISRR